MRKINFKIHAICSLFCLLVLLFLSNQSYAYAGGSGDVKAKWVITYVNGIPQHDCTTCDPDGACTAVSCTPPDK